MIMLVFALLLSTAAPAPAQSTLQLPDVTLFGEYTLFIAPPAPRALGIPAAKGMSDNRLSYPRSLYKVDLTAPDPPLVYWQAIPRSLLAPPGLLPDSPVSDASQYAGAGRSAASGSWWALVDYIPGSTIMSDLATIRSSGVWDLSVLLHFDLADGWITSPPESPTALTFEVQSRRRAPALNIDAAFAMGAFYNAGASAVYALGLNAGLYGQAGVFQWREETRLLGISGVGVGSPPVDTDVQRGAVQQELELALAGSHWDLSLRSGGVLAAGLPSSETEEHGCANLELGWHPSSSVLRLLAGGAALYYEDSLAFYPSGALELYPSAYFSLLIRAAPFIRLPAQRLQTLCAVQAVAEGSGIPHLQTEGGYSLYSELRFDPGAVFAAAVSFDWTKGRIYLLDASDRDWGESGEMSFTDTNRGALQGDLIWRLRAGQPGLRLNLTGTAAVDFPLTAASWQELLYSRAGVVWTTDFHKLPVEFIIKGLIGDFADDGSREFVFTDWEIRSGIVTSIEGNWKIGTNGVLHTGFEAFLSPNFSYRFLIGYDIHR